MVSAENESFWLGSSLMGLTLRQACPAKSNSVIMRMMYRFFMTMVLRRKGKTLFDTDYFGIYCIFAQNLTKDEVFWNHNSPFPDAFWFFW